VTIAETAVAGAEGLVRATSESVLDLLDGVASTLYELQADVDSQSTQVEQAAYIVLWGIFAVFFAVGLCALCVGLGDGISPRMRSRRCLNCTASSVTLFVAFVSLIVAAVALGIAIFLASYVMCFFSLAVTA
jgi:F0F1-type ATP synthase membrane subunit c/vacuolar-type H+-ATPase subunit K